MPDERTPSGQTETMYQHHLAYARRLLANAEAPRAPFFREGADDAEIAADHLFSCAGETFVGPGKSVPPDTINVATLALLLRRVRADERRKRAAPIASAVEAKVWLVERVGGALSNRQLDDLAEDLACLIEDTRDVE